MCDHLREASSKILSGENVTKKVKLEESDNKQVEEVNIEEPEKGVALSYTQMMKNVLKTRSELCKKQTGRCTVKAKRLLQRAKRFSIDVNLNMKLSKLMY